MLRQREREREAVEAVERADPEEPHVFGEPDCRCLLCAVERLRVLQRGVRPRPRQPWEPRVD